MQDENPLFVFLFFFVVLARAHGLTAYESAYLDLALRTGLPLATLDSQLADAARKAGVAVMADGL